MNLYLDASALVKNYVDEPGSAQLRLAMRQATLLGTHLISRVEVAVAFAKAVRTKALPAGEAVLCLRRFRTDWPNFIRLGVSEVLVAHADMLAWNHGLRAYDAVQLAAALLWQEMLASQVTFTCFDARLWKIAGDAGLQRYPEDLKLGL